jgi:hypothetical protein
MMNRQNLLSLMIASAALGMGTAAIAQQGGSAGQSSDAYQGVSQPPSDPIISQQEPVMVQGKPAAGVVAQPAPMPAPGPAPRAQAYVGDSTLGTDAGIVNPPAPMPLPTSQPLYNRPEVGGPIAGAGFVDPDGDIVHPMARPGELLAGATIRVRLMSRISSSQSEKGEPFRGQVAYDVLQNGRVLIPAGSGIEGRISAVSGGHFGGHGSFRLRPEEVVLPDGTRFQLHAETTGTPGSHTRVGGEGTINPGSRAKKDGIEYGAVVGTGAITGAVLGGPVGALTGSLIGAGIVTTHLMVDHPQATLEPGSMLLFSLTEPMNLMPAANGN